MKTMFKIPLLLLATAALLWLFGGFASAGDCPHACQVAAVKVQQVAVTTAVQPVAIVAAPVYVVPGTPTVAIQSIVAAPIVVEQQKVIVQQQKVVQQKIVQQKVVQQVQVNPARVRSVTIQRFRSR